MKRRDFLKHSLTTAAAIALPHSRLLGANNDIRVAMVGLGSFVKIGG
ncbi:MAG: twin-arginine translocation signal domain-containing protein, partial [Planctomycetota bacterium]